MACGTEACHLSSSFFWISLHLWQQCICAGVNAVSQAWYWLLCHDAMTRELRLKRAAAAHATCSAGDLLAS